MDCFRIPLVPSEISHGFFGRRGGVSQGVYATLNCAHGIGDEEHHVTENRLRTLQALFPNKPASDPVPLIVNKQIHSTTVHLVTQDHGLPSSPLEGDGLVTQIPQVALAVMTADCAPILFYCPISKTIGACHAGWRGAFHGVIQETVATMVSVGAQVTHMISMVGPCIAQASYEVDEAFRQNFMDQSPLHQCFFIPSPVDNASHKWNFDLRGYVTHQLQAAGINRIEHIALDTYAEETLLFSCRRNSHQQHSRFGDQVSLIALAYSESPFK